MRFRDGAGGSCLQLGVRSPAPPRAITFASDETLSLLGTDNLTIANNVFGQNFGRRHPPSPTSSAARGPAEITALAAANFIRDTGIEVETEDTDGDTFNDNLVSVTVDRAAVGAASRAQFDFNDDDNDFFSEVGYIGAINPNADRQWFTGWTFVDQADVLEVEGTVR